MRRAHALGAFLAAMFCCGAVMLLLALAGCAMIHDSTSPPAVRYVLSPASVPDTYARAYQAAGRMGATVVREDPDARIFVATTKQGVALHVHVGQTTEGTALTVSAMMLPEHVGFGALTEADTFVATYHQGR